jgi:hypothetical protein
MSHELDESRRLPRRQLLKAAGLGSVFALLEAACGGGDVQGFKFPEGQSITIADLSMRMPQLIEEIRKFPEVKVNYIRTTKAVDVVNKIQPVLSIGSVRMGGIVINKGEDEDVELNFDLKDDLLSSPWDFTTTSPTAYLIGLNGEDADVIKGRRTRGPVKKGKTTTGVNSGLHFIFPEGFKESEIAFVFDNGLFKDNNSAAFLPLRFNLNFYQKSPLRA